MSPSVWHPLHVLCAQHAQGGPQAARPQHWREATDGVVRRPPVPKATCARQRPQCASVSLPLVPLSTHGVHRSGHDPVRVRDAVRRAILGRCAGLPAVGDHRRDRRVQHRPRGDAAGPPDRPRPPPGPPARRPRRRRFGSGASALSDLHRRRDRASVARRSGLSASRPGLVRAGRPVREGRQRRQARGRVLTHCRRRVEGEGFRCAVSASGRIS